MQTEIDALRAERDAARAETAELYQLLRQSFVLMSVMSGPDHVITFANDANLRLLGKTAQEVIGRSVRETFPAASGYADLHHLLDQVYQTGQPFVGQPPPAPFDLAGTGEPKPTIVQTIYHPWRNTQGEIQGVMFLGTDITAQVEAQEQLAALNAELEARVAERTEELHQSQALLQTVLDNLPALVFVRDRDYRFVLNNRTYYEATNLAPEDVIGQYDSAIFPPEMVAEWRAQDQHVVESGQAQQFEHTYQSPAGPRSMLSIKFPIFDRTGAFTLLGGIALDITEQKQLEAQVQRNAAQVRTMMETMPVGCLILQEQHYIYANTAAERLTGYTRAELATLDPMAILHPAYREAVTEWADRLLAGADLPPRDEIKVVARTGEEYWVDLYAYAVEFEAQPALFLIAQDITERKRQEADLRVIFDNVSDGIFIHPLDDVGTILEVNQQMLTTYRVDRATALALTVADFSSPSNDMDAIGQMLQRAIDGERPTFVWKARRPGDGSEFDVEVTLRRVDFQQRACIMATSRDITERKRQEAELLLRQYALDNASDMVELMDANGRFVYVNNATCRNLGYTRDELLAMALSDLDPNFPAEAWPDLWNHVQEMGSIALETVQRRKDGSTIPLDVSGTYCEIAGERFGIAVLRDITERKRQEAQLRQRDERLERLFNNSVVGMYNTTPDGHFAMASPAMATLLGYDSPDELIQTVTNIAQQLYVNAEQRSGIVERILDKQEVLQEQVEFRCKDGRVITVLLTAWAVPNAEGSRPHMEGFVQDITGQIQAEAERAALQEQIIEAQRDALRELSTPLIPITNEVVIMPLIGTIDSLRAQMVLEVLLDGVARHQAELAIIDITGVVVVDTQVAQAFIQAAQAVRLLGAQVMLTGIQPQIAQTLVHLGTDLGGIITHGSLQAGIAAVLQRGRQAADQSASGPIGIGR